MVDVAAPLFRDVPRDEEASRFRPLAWPLGVLGLAISATTAVLVVLNRSRIHNVDGADPIELVLPIGYAIIGALLASRRSRHPIGWLFLGIAIFTGFPGVATQYVFRSSHFHHLPAAAWMGWMHDWMVWLVFPNGLAFYFFLFFPDGRLPSPRWRWLVWSATVLLAIGLTLVMIEEKVQLTGSPALRNPLGVHGIDLNGPLGAIWIPGLLMVVAAMAGTILRRRRATAEVREQLRWLAYAAGATAVGLVSGVVVGSSTSTGFTSLWWDCVTVLGFGVAVPVSCGIAILKHGLYGLDVVVSKAVVYGVVAAFFTAVYLAVVVGIGTAVGSTRSPALTVLAAALIALAVNPVRERAKHIANRVVYGKRATPYEILSEFSQGMASASAGDGGLSRMARLVVEATGALSTTVWVRLGDSLQAETSWPPTDVLPAPISVDGRGPAEALAHADPRARTFLVEHDAELLGALAVVPSPSEPLTVSGEKLIADLAAQTGLGLSFERMKERALYARALASFLPPEVADLVEASPSALELREEVEATILFSDMRGFSTLAERLPPREVAEVVGRHLEAMAEIVAAHGGTLDKFAGDAVMAVFGAPRRIDDHAAQAIRCAIAMQQRQAALNDEAATLGLPGSEIGIGVNTGDVIAGTVGGSGRLDYTVLGDAVNVAQRLQSEAAEREILAAAATVSHAGVAAEPAGLRRLKGREEPVETFLVPWR